MHMYESVEPIWAHTVVLLQHSQVTSDCVLSAKQELG